MADMIDFVIYHHPCPDGMAAAWAVWHYLTQNGRSVEKVIFHPANYSGASSVPPDVTGRHVLIADFSYPLDVLQTMIEQAASFLLIDHHKTAQEALQKLRPRHKIFDMDHSGAHLVWRHLFPTTPPPLMIQYVEDHDIWTKALPGTHEYAAWFPALVPYTLAAYDEYGTDDARFHHDLVTLGPVALAKDRIVIRDAASRATVKFQRVAGISQPLLVAYVNSTTLVSEIGNAVIQEWSEADVAAVYSVKDWSNATHFSLRSQDDRFDASVVAKAVFSGGGHRNASGCSVPYVCNTLPGTVLDATRATYDAIRNHRVGPDNVVYCQVDGHLQDAVVEYWVARETPRESHRVVAAWQYSASDDTTTFSLGFVPDVTTSERVAFMAKLVRRDEESGGNRIVVSGSHIHLVYR